MKPVAKVGKKRRVGEEADVPRDDRVRKHPKLSKEQKAAKRARMLEKTQMKEKVNIEPTSAATTEERLVRKKSKLSEEEKAAKRERKLKKKQMKEESGKVNIEPTSAATSEERFDDDAQMPLEDEDDKVEESEEEEDGSNSEATQSDRTEDEVGLVLGGAHDAIKEAGNLDGTMGATKDKKTKGASKGGGKAETRISIAGKLYTVDPCDFRNQSSIHISGHMLPVLLDVMHYMECKVTKDDPSAKPKWLGQRFSKQAIMDYVLQCFATEKIKATDVTKPYTKAEVKELLDRDNKKGPTGRHYF